VPFLDLYTKQVLANRTAIPKAILLNVTELLRHCSHDEFKDQVLPAAQKAMLRNPEVIQDAVSELVRGVKLDLSQYALDVMKLFAGPISSKDETSRTIAVQAMKNLAIQCSDSGAIEKLAQNLFKILGGVGNLVYNTVSGTSTLQALSTTVALMFLPTLQQEVHEGTLVHTLSMLSLWCGKFYTEVPDKLLEWFQKGMALKTSTSAVRNEYIRCMNAAFHADTMHQASKILPLLLQTLDKAEKQPNQQQLVAEMVSASCLLVKLAAVDIEAESKLGPFWNMILDTKKQHLVNTKFLSSASDETLQSLIFLLERLISEFPSKMSETVSKPYYRALIFCLCRKSWAVRRAAITSTKKILSLLGGAQIAVSLIEEFQKLQQDQTLSDLTQLVSKDEEASKSDSGESNKVVAARTMSSALQSICAVEKVDPVDAEKIALITLIPTHHPYIGKKSLSYCPRAGRPKSCVNEQTVASIKKDIDEDPHISVRELSNTNGLSYGTVHTIITEHLRMKKVCARWIPHLLTEDQKRERVHRAMELLSMFEPHGPKRLSDILTGDETWFPFFIIPPKRLNRMWVDGQGDRPVVLRPGFQSRKRIFTVFFNYSGPLVVDILHQDSTMTATYHVQNVLSQVKSAINEQRSKVSTSRTLLLHDNADPHKARATTQSLREQGIQVLPYPAYSPDLAPCSSGCFRFCRTD
ncbi:translational activator GCN1-like, partial [Elysia marginata]